MSENASTRPKWPYAAVAALFLVLGVDIGMRLAGRGAAASSPVAAVTPQTGAAPAAPAAANGSTKIVVVHTHDRGSNAEPDSEGAPAPATPPNPMREEQDRLVAQWAKQADAGPLYAGRAAEPPMPAPSGKYAELLASAQAARGKGDKDAAIELFKQAEDAATDPRQKEEMRFQRLWVCYDRGDFKEVRRIAEAIGERPVRAEARKQAGEILAKLDVKGGK